MILGRTLLFALAVLLVALSKAGGPPIYSGPGPTYSSMPNAGDWPISYTPYAGSSLINTPVSGNPTVLASSAAIVAAQFPTNPPIVIKSEEAGATNDFYHPRYFATYSDPWVAISCSKGGGVCNSTDNGGYPANIHIPWYAMPASGTDHHMIVVQPDGTEIDFWNVTPPTGAWGTTGNTSIVTASAINAGNFNTGIGYLPNGGASMSGLALHAGLVTATELMAGVINHSLYLFGPCNGATGIGGAQSQFPSSYNLTQCSGVGPPMGGRMWYDVPDATTNATSLKPWEKAILNALHDYGGYVADTQTSMTNYTGFVVEMESDTAWCAQQAPMCAGPYTSPFAQLVAAPNNWTDQIISNCWGATSCHRYVGNYNWNPWTTIGETMATFASHIKWLDPCSAHNTC